MSRPTDQATRLRAMMQTDAETPRRVDNERTPPRIIAIASGKGGVGKTVLSVHLSRALAYLGKQVTLIDADHGTANADLLLGLNPATRLGASACQPIRVPDCPKLRLIAGSVGRSDPATQHAALRQTLVNLGRTSDVFVVDLGASITPGILTVLQHAWLPIIMTTPEPTATADAYALYKSLVASGGTRAGVLVNQASNEHEAKDVFARFAHAAEQFIGARPARLGWLPNDEMVRSAVRGRRPVRPGPFAKSIGSFARRCAQSLGVEPSAKPARNPEVQQEIVAVG